MKSELLSIAIEAKQISLTDETAQVLPKNEKYEKLNWQAWDNLLERRPEPFRRLFQLATDVINDAKHLAEAYGVDVSDALRAVEISLELSERETK